MRWTRLVAGLAVTTALAGCAAGYATRSVTFAYDSGGRPEGSYYCYDCHGYRYFDPYYDWCSYYGFRYTWQQHPRAVVVYRQRYVQIKQSHPGFGRYRYPGDYREGRRYRQPADFERWRSGQLEKAKRSSPERQGREKTPGHEGSNRRDRQDRRPAPADSPGSGHPVPEGAQS